MSRSLELVLLHRASASIPLHVQLVISSYLGPAPNMTLSETCSFGSIALLDWMWDASCTRVSERTPWWSLTNFLRSDPHYYRWQFAESMKVAAGRGDLTIVAWLLEHFRGCVVPSFAVVGAAGNGHLEVLRLLWAHDGGRPDRERNDVKKRKVVTSSGYVVAQSSPGDNVMQWSSNSFFFAVLKRQPDVVRWLHEHTPLESDDSLGIIIQAVVDANDWELAKFLLPTGRCLLDYAGSSSRNPEMIEWMFDCGYLQRDSNAAVCAIGDLAASNDNLPLMRRIAALHDPPPLDWGATWREAMHEACTTRKLKSFRWLVGHPTGVRICENIRQGESIGEFAALALGHEDPVSVDMLQFLYDHGIFVGDTPKTLLLDAITFGQPLEVLKWLVGHLSDSQRLPEYCVMDEAAAIGRLEVVQYFQRLQLSAFSRNTFGHSDREDSNQSDDAPLWCSTKAMDGAAANGHLEMVKWLHENRPEGCTVAAMDGAASNGHLEVVKWLHTNRMEGCTVAAVDEAASNGHLETLKWLHANTNAGCTPEAMDNAARGGHLETLMWLHDNTSEGCTVEAINNALRLGHFRVASWLHAHFPEFIPAKLDTVWTVPPITFEELLFRQEHYGDIFTAGFLRRLRSRELRIPESDKWSWVKDEYIGA